MTTTNSTTPSSTSTHTETKRIDRLFARLSAIYGYLWRNQYTTDEFIALAKKEWGETLSTIDNNSIKLAIDECKRKIDMPPTLPCFYQLCRNFQTGNKIRKIETPELKKASPEIAEKHLKEIKNIVNQKRL